MVTGWSSSIHPHPSWDQERGMGRSGPGGCQGPGSHHGQLSLQLLHAVVFEVQLGAQRRGVVRGLLGLAPQLPLLTLQQVLLLGQCPDGLLAFLQGQRFGGPWQGCCCPLGNFLGGLRPCYLSASGCCHLLQLRPTGDPMRGCVGMLG